MAAQAINVYDWMCLNVDRVVEAVRQDGGRIGDNAQRVLDETDATYQDFRSREKARDLLSIRLAKAGFGGVL